MALALGPTSLPLLAAEVQNCGDGGPGSGSLRDVITNAMSGDTIDLSQLPTKCGMADSVITLSNGEVVIGQNDLKLEGPSAGSVTIEPAAGKQSRIFRHTGTGLLVIDDLIVADGRMYDGYGAMGGCIYSLGSVFLSRSTVTNCIASAAYALGGGVGAAGAIVLLNSIVSQSHAVGTIDGEGGGIYAKDGISILYSTLRGNSASNSGGGASTVAFGVGSGVHDYVYNSTIEGNTAANCGAATLYTLASVDISNSTVSGNTAVGPNGGVCARGDVTVANSTIAFNTATDVSGGLYAWNGSLTLHSSIIANNGTLGVPDLYSGTPATSGANNLVMSAGGNVPPGLIKIASDPKLGPLQYNGGSTRTHALLPGSPAIGTGNNTVYSWWDQRGRGYPRTTGASYSTDIGAYQFDSIFFEDFDG